MSCARNAFARGIIFERPGEAAVRPPRCCRRTTNYQLHVRALRYRVRCMNFCVAQGSHAIQRDASPRQCDISIHAEIIIYPANCRYIDVDNDNVYRPECCPYSRELPRSVRPPDKTQKRQRAPGTKDRKVAQDAENRASFFRSFKETNSMY